MFVPDRTVQPVQVIGAANGTMSMAEGFREALAAVAVAADAIEAPPADTMPPYRILPLWQVPGSGKAFVDFANDVTAGDVALAARENYVSVEHLKRYTTLGMGIDQGKTSNVNGLAIMGERTGRAPAAVGTTRFRPPYAPVTIGTYAGTQVGQMYRPLRYLPAHAFHLERGAVLEEFGGWLRPTAYLQHGEDWEAAARREAGAVRAGVGLFDGSPLGKIEVSGPDAGRFLDRIYVGTASTLKPGRARYGLMLNENGIVVDDGVFIRRDQDSFLVHTTSGGAERIAGVLEEWLQCEWVDLDVTVVQVTAQWANMTISGPNARQLLQAVGTDIDLAADSFAHMSYREGTVAGCEARIARVSYTGEISFEISVAAGKGEWLARLLWQHGEPIGLVPYGIEALMILRTEKGYLHVGVDTEGTTLPDDIGMAGPIAKKASDFVGRRSLSRSDALRKDRLQLVGLLAGDASRLHPGAHIMGGATVPCPIDGYVTSSADSPTLHHPIALALVRNGRRRLGETVEVYDMGVTRQARIVDTVFFDKEGARLHG
jgi:sarcosine oxidase subunit alpha